MAKREKSKREMMSMLGSQQAGLGAFGINRGRRVTAVAEKVAWQRCGSHGDMQRAGPGTFGINSGGAWTTDVNVLDAWTADVTVHAAWTADVNVLAACRLCMLFIALE
eukprot:222017-Chlamydomonas_euryale.AAC.2